MSEFPGLVGDFFRVIGTGLILSVVQYLVLIRYAYIYLLGFSHTGFVWVAGFEAGL